METVVWIPHYEQSMIDERMFTSSAANTVMIKTVKNFQEKLVEIVTPDGNRVTVNAAELITAVKKCVL